MKIMTRYRGFSLIELLVVLMIIGILAVVSLPQYKRYVQRANRADGVEAVQAVLAAQERYYADHRQYSLQLSLLGFAGDSFKSRQGLYQISARGCEQLQLTICVEVVATALGQQASDGDLVANSQGKQLRGNNLSW